MDYQETGEILTVLIGEEKRRREREREGWENERFEIVITSKMRGVMVKAKSDLRPWE